MPPPGRVRWLRPSEIAHGDQSVLFVGDSPGDGRMVSGQVGRAVQLHPFPAISASFWFERLGDRGGYSYIQIKFTPSVSDARSCLDLLLVPERAERSSSP